jgi:hypothetical protein
MGVGMSTIRWLIFVKLLGLSAWSEKWYWEQFVEKWIKGKS